jgi:hypothetical protein
VWGWVGLKIDRHATLRDSWTLRAASRSDAKCLQQRRGRAVQGRAKQDEGNFGTYASMQVPSRANLPWSCESRPFVVIVDFQCGVPKKEFHPASYHF